MRRVVLLTVLILSPAIYANLYAQARGGSSYLWYQVDGPDQFECYGTIKNYHVPSVASEVNSRLSEMYSNGQRRLRFLIHFVHDAGVPPACESKPDGAKGMYMNSNGYDAQYYANLSNYMAYARDLHFEEFELAMGPGGPNHPDQWGCCFDWNMYFENWNVIVNTRAIAVQVGVPFKIDLSNELFAFIHGPIWLYGYFLWRDYVSTFGKADTSGFSFGALLGDESRQVNQAMSVYDSSGYGRPYLYALHIYNDPYVQFVNWHNALGGYGEYSGVTITEAFYNSGWEAYWLSMASADTNRYIYYLLQWPKNYPSTMNVDTAPVTDFIGYITWGF